MHTWSVFVFTHTSPPSTFMFLTRYLWDIFLRDIFSLKERERLLHIIRAARGGRIIPYSELYFFLCFSTVIWLLCTLREEDFQTKIKPFKMYVRKSASAPYFSVLKNIAQPSTCFFSCSDMILARDFGEKNPSYPRSFNAGRKRVKYCSVSTSWNWTQIL